MRAARVPLGLGCAALLLGACFPHVTHGPTVVAGSSVGFAAGAGAGRAGDSCHPTEPPDPVNGEPSSRGDCPAKEGGLIVLATLSHSWKNDLEGSGLRIGADIPLVPAPEALLLTQLSAYWQRPRPADAGTDRGLGVLVSAAWVAPYLQWGRSPAGERGWFTTQMVSIAHPLGGYYEGFGIGWHPTLTYQFPGAPRRAGFAGVGSSRLFVGAGIDLSPTREPAPRGHEWKSYLKGGMGWEIHLAR